MKNTNRKIFIFHITTATIWNDEWRVSAQDVHAAWWALNICYSYLICPPKNHMMSSRVYNMNQVFLHKVFQAARDQKRELLSRRKDQGHVYSSRQSICAKCVEEENIFTILKQWDPAAKLQVCSTVVSSSSIIGRMVG